MVLTEIVILTHAKGIALCQAKHITQELVRIMNPFVFIQTSNLAV